MKGGNNLSKSDGKWTSLYFSHALLFLQLQTKQFSCAVHGDSRKIKNVWAWGTHLCSCAASQGPFYAFLFVFFILEKEEQLGSSQSQSFSEKTPFFFFPAFLGLRLAWWQPDWHFRVGKVCRADTQTHLYTDKQNCISDVMSQFYLFIYIFLWFADR